MKERNKKINYMTASKIRFLYQRKDQTNIKDGETINPFSKEALMTKFNINERTFKAIINNKIYNKPPKFKEQHYKQLNQVNQDFICQVFHKLRDGYTTTKLIGLEDKIMDNGEVIQIPQYEEVKVAPVPDRHIIKAIQEEIKADLGEQSYLKIYRILVKHGLIGSTND